MWFSMYLELIFKTYHNAGERKVCFIVITQTGKMIAQLNDDKLCIYNAMPRTNIK